MQGRRMRRTQGRPQRWSLQRRRTRVAQLSALVAVVVVVLFVVVQPEPVHLLGVDAIHTTVVVVIVIVVDHGLHAPPDGSPPVGRRAFRLRAS